MKSLLVVSVFAAAGIFVTLAIPQGSQFAPAAGAPYSDSGLTARAMKAISCLDERAQEERNKEIAIALWQGAFGDHDVSSVDKYVHPTVYIQHNPNVADGPGPLKELVQIWNETKPKEKVDIRRVAANGDLVWLHVRSQQEDGKYFAMVVIFRLENGKVVEHWDVMQTVPELSESKNPHPLF